ncbi:uncharacterized protein LOC106716029 [Papilio machaon]|uniref:uncharacterized protein LOC106716029 n=1 Tax=Papilio machaon TaxID=76193 RepID=UPI001E663C3B|nr:uncharacterized protein LOC106716029 [Papilio machaon]
MDSYYVLLTLFYAVQSNNIDIDKLEFCKNLNCDEWPNLNVCGIREESDGFRLKLFESECQLLEYGCKVDNDETYGLINLEYCKKAFIQDFYPNADLNNKTVEVHKGKTDECTKINCTLTNKEKICGLKKHGAGYKVRIFKNECELKKHNCDTKSEFVETDLFICNSLSSNVSTTSNENTIKSNEEPKDIILNNIVVIDGNMLGYKNNINDTIETFFAATHVLDMPMREVSPDFVNEITRRRQIKIAGPIKVFQPWTTIPSNITDDYLHSPTLSSCFHKCPTKCPDTYAPVCGVPGIVAREPSLMFQNHCFMDVAQCKMRWEDKSPTAISSSYIESSFMFCLGDQLNAMYRFLPLVRTLQHMGRLKKKGRFKYKLRNMRFFNSLLSRDPKLMG